jgi:hypothetical protein
MKKNFCIVAVLLLTSQTAAPSEKDTVLWSVPDRTSNIPGRYLYSLADTASHNDTLKQMYVKQGLFAELCIQASKATSLDQKPFQELLLKVSNGDIDRNAQLMTMTKKDGYHRLLSYIPQPNYYAQVNGYLVDIMIRKKCIAIKIEHKKTETALDEFLGDGFFGGNNVSSKPTEVEEITTYHGLGDTAEHKEIVKKFEELVQNASDGK